MTYLNVDEVETAIALAAGPANADFTELITLPYPTWEGRTCHAVRIHHGVVTHSGVYLLGGVHAREWGSPDILINFVQLLTDAYRTGTGIIQGGATVSAEQVRAIVDTLDIVVFPQANPDGRHYSMTVDPMWRKNRRPADAGDPGCMSGGGSGPGVDINRNYDFLWDFPTAFNSSAPVATSADPCAETYYGPDPASEPETKNVVWLLDNSPNMGYFIDLHSFGEGILHNWGNDDNQTTDPSMSFANPSYDGKRGIPDVTPGGDPDKYREFIPVNDRNTLITLGTVTRDAIQAAHGRTYTVKQSVGLYPTSGTSDDYAYSRSFLDPSNDTVLGYTIEWGPQRSSIPKSFHPDYPDMVPIIEEVTAGLLAFCLAVTQRTLDRSHAQQKDFYFADGVVRQFIYGRTERAVLNASAEVVTVNCTARVAPAAFVSEIDRLIGGLKDDTRVILSLSGNSGIKFTTMSGVRRLLVDQAFGTDYEFVRLDVSTTQSAFWEALPGESLTLVGFGDQTSTFTDDSLGLARRLLAATVTSAIDLNEVLSSFRELAQQYVNGERPHEMGVPE